MELAKGDAVEARLELRAGVLLLVVALQLHDGVQEGLFLGGCRSDALDEGEVHGLAIVLL